MTNWIWGAIAIAIGYGSALVVFLAALMGRLNGLNEDRASIERGEFFESEGCEWTE